MRGNIPQDECINNRHSLDHCLLNRLNLDEVVAKLKGMSHIVDKSFSAGEYICNYIYYCSLEHKNSKVLDSERVDTLFCHVPSFKEIDEKS